MISNSTFLKKNSVKSSPLFQPKIRQLKKTLFAVLLFVFIGFSANAQETVYWRSEAARSNWNDSEMPWYRICDGWWIERPDYICNSNSTIGRNYVNIDNNSQTNMSVNGVFFNIKSLTFKSGASNGRTFNNGGSGGINVDAGIGNEDGNYNTHTFNVPIALGASCSFNSLNATYSFTTNFYLNNFTATFQGNNNVSGVVSESGGSGSIINSSGTLTLSAANTFTGLTTITGGTLKLNASGGALKSGNDVTIAGGTLLVMQSQTLRNISISAGGTLTVDAGVTLTITGTTTNAGIINNEGTITNTGTLKNTSNVSGTGYLLSAASTANVTQERYLTSNQRGWRLLSNPLSTTTFGDLALGSTTPFTLGANASGAYDSAENTWSSGVDANDIAFQKAYKVFIRGRSSEVNGLVYSVHPPSNVTVSITGTATNAAPAEISTVAGRYYLVANPYTAPVSVASILTASSLLSGTVSYYNPTQGSSGIGIDLENKKGGYDAVTVGDAGSANDVILPPMGAIFVQASSAGNIKIPTSVIFTGTVLGGNYNHKTASPQNVSPIALTVNVSSNGVDYDKLQLRFKEAGTVGSNIDFGKMPNTILDFYSIDGANNMAVSELELVEQTIPLGINSTALQSFRFSIAENSIPAGFEAVLEDKLLNTQTVLTTGTNYDFSIDATAPSQGIARFDIVLKTMAPLSVIDNTLDTKIIIWPNPAHNQFFIKNNQQEGDATIKIYSMTGQLIHSDKAVPGATTTLNANGWASGHYILEATHNGAKTTKQLIIQ
jgi:autotransporter-associated beta strand protein